MIAAAVVAAVARLITEVPCQDRATNSSSSIRRRRRSSSSSSNSSGVSQLWDLIEIFCFDRDFLSGFPKNSQV